MSRKFGEETPQKAPRVWTHLLGKGLEGFEGSKEDRDGTMGHKLEE